MVFLFYNKWLIRLLVVLVGACIAMVGWNYTSLSVAKLPQQGLQDSLAIISFLIAGWLVMLIAEVVDNHYVRVLGCLCLLLGAFVSFGWIFRIDGPKLIELPAGPAAMSQAGLGFWLAVALTLIMLFLLVARLIMDKANMGRVPVAAAKQDVDLGKVSEVVTEAKPAEPELEPIPVSLPKDDAAAVAEPSQPAAQPAEAPAHAPGPVSALTGISGVYLGSHFELKPGSMTIGRQGADIELANDNQVSRNHAQLQVADDGIVTVSDSGSTNGTFVNDQRVDSCQLAPGDTVRIGTTLFKAEA